MSRFSLFIFFLFAVSLFPAVINAENTSDKLDVNWENSGDITFLVESNQWFQFGIGINSTSDEFQTINIEINGESNWGIQDSIFVIKNKQISNNESFELLAYENLSITVQIFIPEIENGMPLAETEYPFKLKLTNESGKNTSWDYGLSIRPKYSVEVEEIIERKEIDPFGNSIHEIKIKNTGNIQTGFSSDISPITLQGEIIENDENTRFSYLGWNATISGGTEELILEPNQSDTLKISINSPYESQGNLSLLVNIKSNTGGVEELIYLNSSITVQKNISFELNGENCLEISNNQKCKLDIVISNRGNYKEQLGNISCISTSEFIYFKENLLKNEIELFNSELIEIILEPNELKMIEFNINSTISKINAGSNEEIICTYSTFNSNQIKTAKLELSINEFHNITYKKYPLKWIENNKLFICMEIENKGNTAESFSVGISVSHEGNHGLITPPNSTFEQNASRIRGYYIENIQPNQKLNITGWMEIPTPGIQDEIIWISIQVNSVPNFFEDTWKVNETIKGTNNENNSNNELKTDLISNKFLNLFNKYGYPSIATLISIIMIIKAIGIRRKRKYPEIQTEQKNNDWMSSFFNKKDTSVDLTSPQINKKEFKEIFSKNSNENKDYTSKKVDFKQIEEASKKLGKTINNNSKNDLIAEILEDLDENEYDF